MFTHAFLGATPVAAGTLATDPVFTGASEVLSSILNVEAIKITWKDDAGSIHIDLPAQLRLGIPEATNQITLFDITVCHEQYVSMCTECGGVSSVLFCAAMDIGRAKVRRDISEIEIPLHDIGAWDLIMRNGSEAFRIELDEVMTDFFRFESGEVYANKTAPCISIKNAMQAVLDSIDPDGDITFTPGLLGQDYRPAIAELKITADPQPGDTITCTLAPQMVVNGVALDYPILYFALEVESSGDRIQDMQRLGNLINLAPTNGTAGEVPIYDIAARVSAEYDAANERILLHTPYSIDLSQLIIDFGAGSGAATSGHVQLSVYGHGNVHLTDLGGDGVLDVSWQDLEEYAKRKFGYEFIYQGDTITALLPYQRHGLGTASPSLFVLPENIEEAYNEEYIAGLIEIRERQDVSPKDFEDIQNRRAANGIIDQDLLGVFIAQTFGQAAISGMVAVESADPAITHFTYRIDHQHAAGTTQIASGGPHPIYDVIGIGRVGNGYRISHDVCMARDDRILLVLTATDALGNASGNSALLTVSGKRVASVEPIAIEFNPSFAESRVNEFSWEDELPVRDFGTSNCGGFKSERPPASYKMGLGTVITDVIENATEGGVRAILADTTGAQPVPMRFIQRLYYTAAQPSGAQYGCMADHTDEIHLYNLAFSDPYNAILMEWHRGWVLEQYGYDHRHEYTAGSYVSDTTAGAIGAGTQSTIHGPEPLLLMTWDHEGVDIQDALAAMEWGYMEIPYKGINKIVRAKEITLTPHTKQVSATTLIQNQ